MLASCLTAFATEAITKRGVKLFRSVRDANFRGSFEGTLTPTLAGTSTLAGTHLMRRTWMQDESTFYDIILSGAESLSEINELLSMRDPHFVKLSQNEFDTLIDQWLFQMLAK